MHAAGFPLVTTEVTPGKHPGGDQILRQFAGKDASKAGIFRLGRRTGLPSRPGEAGKGAFSASVRVLGGRVTGRVELSCPQNCGDGERTLADENTIDRHGHHDETKQADINDISRPCPPISRLHVTWEIRLCVTLCFAKGAQM